MFKYSKEKELTELEDRLTELSKLSVENVTIEDIENGIYSNEEKISNVNAAITAHTTASIGEYNKHIKAENAEKTLAFKQAAYPQSVAYVAALKKVLEIVDSVKGGHDYRPMHDFELLQSKELHAFKNLIRKAEKGLNHLKQFKVN